MKHTPGPWELRDVSGAGLQIWAVVDLGRGRIEGTDIVNGPRLQPLYEVNIKPQLEVGADGTAYAMITYETWYQFPSTAFDQMQNANARLIAAAPDLLEACKRALPYLADHIALTLNEGPGDRIVHDLMEAAIAKAEAES